jgi:hypothetical protein
MRSIKRPTVLCMGNRSLSTPKRKQAIIDLLRKGHGYEQAARATGVSGAALRKWRLADPGFAGECEAAADYVGDVAESVLLARGLKGDTVALIVWLKAHRPELYHRRMLVALGGDPDNPLTIEHSVAPPGRLIILPANNRPELSALEIQSEREAVARENLLEVTELEGVTDDSVSDSDTAK